MKSGEHRDKLAKKEEVIAFEMEGARVWDNLSCAIIRGVYNYADSHKNDTWQAYESGNSGLLRQSLLTVLDTNNLSHSSCQPWFSYKHRILVNSVPVQPRLCRSKGITCRA